MEKEPAKDSAESKEKKCPFCGAKLPADTLFFLDNDLILDAHVPCPACHRTIRKADLK